MQAQWFYYGDQFLPKDREKSRQIIAQVAQSSDKKIAIDAIKFLDDNFNF